MVDDNEMLTRFTAINLQSAIPGLRVVTARSCGEAKAMLDRHCPKVVIVDWLLPDGDGSELLEHIADALPNSRVVFLSADAGAARRRRPDAAFEVLSKPVEAEHLVQVVERALGHATSLAGRAPSEPDKGEVPEEREQRKHRLANRLTGLMAGLRALEADLRDAAQSSESVDQVLNEYMGYLLETAREVYELVR
jgi:DNA-binding NtrC family response regulator